MRQSNTAHIENDAMWSELDNVKISLPHFGVWM